MVASQSQGMSSSNMRELELKSIPSVTPPFSVHWTLLCDLPHGVFTVKAIKAIYTLKLGGNWELGTR